MKQVLDETDEDVAQRVYELMLARRCLSISEIAEELDLPVDRAEQALDTLRALKLVKYCKTRGYLAAVSPDSAQLELILPLEQAIHDKRRELADFHDQLRSFTDTFSNLQRTQLRQDPVLSNQDPEQARLRLAEAVRDCRSEILTMEPLAPGQGHDSPALDLPGLSPGVRIRALFPHTARTSLVSRGGLRALVESGARVRTSNQAFDHLVIVGGEVAFLPDPHPEQGAPAVTVVYEPTIVSRLVRHYEYAWQSGTDFAANVVSYGETLDEVRSAILDLLASGLKDDVVARRIGMSSRTFRRHLATIMEELHAESRFQAGAAAVRAGLLTGPGGSGRAMVRPPRQVARTAD
ncbi:LuxR family transcriptional regulator [Kitasatospora sp. NBC_00315]|uniref:LuxR family transcriptional regulator n=1 Tax=Kitasatospora sp. NBC_00315 TaxID=2975963 RepID=UPI003250EDAF